MTSSQRPPTLDPVAVARWKALTSAAEAPWLHEEIASRMLDRLQWITLQPQSWANWGAGRGGAKAHAQLAAKYPGSACFIVEAQADIGLSAIKKEAKLPWWKPAALSRKRPTPVAALAAGSVDMLWANMQLHESADPLALIGLWHQALKVNGFLMFSCLGPDTAIELRELYRSQGWPPSAHALTDMHDWGDMLVRTGFAEPVMDMERITLTYQTPARLIEELRGLGRNAHPARFAALRGRGWRMQLERAIEQHVPRDAEGRLKLTFEVVYGHALKPVPRVGVSTLSSVSVEDMRSMLKSGAGRNPAA